MNTFSRVEADCIGGRNKEALAAAWTPKLLYAMDAYSKRNGPAKKDNKYCVVRMEQRNYPLPQKICPRQESQQEEPVELILRPEGIPA